MPWDVGLGGVSYAKGCQVAICNEIRPYGHFFHAVYVGRPIFVRRGIVVFPLASVFRSVFRGLSVFLAALLSKDLFYVLLRDPGDPGRGVEVFRLVSFMAREFFVGRIAGYFFHYFRRVLGLISFIGDGHRPQRDGGRVTYATFGP